MQLKALFYLQKELLNMGSGVSLNPFTGQLQLGGSGGSGGGVTAYPNAAALPSTAADGTVAVTTDTDSLYVYNLSTTSWKLVANPSDVNVIGTIDTGTPSANGAQIISDTLVMQSASTTNPGLVNNTTQVFTGQKQFNNGINLPNGQTIQAGGTTVFIADSTSDFNLFVGNNAGNQTLTGNHNTAIGSYAMPSLTTGSDNMAFGYTAGNGLTTGGNNIAIGASALTTNHSGSNNIAIGFNALSVSLNTANIGIGVNALEQITTGQNNTALGFQAGLNGSPAIQTTSNSTFIGYNANASADGQNNSTALGNGAQTTASNQMVFGNSAITNNVFTNTLTINGSSSGAISITTQAASGTYNFNLPITAGTTGYLLTSQGGSSSAMTWTAITGSGNVVLATSPTLVTPALGTPSAAVLTNATGLPLSGLTTQAASTIVGNNTAGSASPTALTVAQVNAILPVFTSTLNGLVPLSGGGTTNFLRADGSWAVAGSGTVTAVSVASSNGFAGTSSGGATPALTLTTSITGILQGNGTAISAAGTTGSGNVVLVTSPTLVTPALGTPSAIVLTNATGTAASLTAGTVTTNANLTGDVTSSGNTTTLASVNSNIGSYTNASITVNAKGLVTAASSAATTGTGNTVLATSPTLATPNLGTPSTLVGTNISGTGASFTAGTATNATNVATTTQSGNTSYFLTFVGANSSSNQGISVGPATYNPSTSTLTATTFVGAVTGHSSLDLLASNNLSDVGTKATAFNNVSPLSTKGDTLVYSTTNIRQAVPFDYGGFVPDSTQASGWRTASYTQDLQGRPGKNYIQYADFENNASTGWSWINTGTLTNGLPTGTPSTGGAVTSALYSFTISTSTTCAAGDTYTNNAQTFTLITALSAQSGTVFFATGTGAPSASGTLTRATGSGTSSITFSASTNETASIVSSGQLAGAYSLSVASSGITVPGLGIQTNFLIDAEDQAKVITIKFYYSVPTNGTANFSGTSSNSIAWAAYDVTNSSWLTSAGNFNLVQATGTGYCTGTFQTNATTANIRFCIYNANATGGATTIYVDDVYVGPQTAPMGPAMTDMVQYTPTFTGMGTPTGVSVFSRRIGDHLFVRGNLLVGTTTGTPGLISLGFNGANANVSLDTSKFVGGGTFTIVGNASINQNNAASFDIIAQASATGTVQLTVQGASNAGMGNTNMSSILSSGQALTFWFEVPIVGWSSNSSQSSDTDTRVIGFRVTGTPTGSVSSSYVKASYPTVISDVAGGYTSGTYTIPVTGYWDFSAGFAITAGTYTAGNYLSAQIQKNGGNIATNTQRIAGTTGNFSIDGVVSVQSVLCNAGDTITVGPVTNLGTPVFAAAIIDSSENFFTGVRRSGPAVITATESVNMRYYSSSTAVTGSLATVVYSTKSWDSHNAYNATTGIYTAPTSGTYQVNASVAMTGTFVLNSILDLQVQQTGSVTQTSEAKSYSGGAVTQMNTNVGDIFHMNAGDQLKVQVSNSGTLPVIAATTTQNWFSLARTGN